MKGAVLTRVYFPKTRPRTFSQCSAQDEPEKLCFYGDPLGAGDGSGWQLLAGGI